jgi:uncharacterized ion transporter superfamily protein YfcC
MSSKENYKKVEKTPKVAQKKKFKIPHLLWLLVGIIVIMSLLTYIIPAGQFGVDEAGNIIGTEFNFIGEQTPVSLIDVIMLLQPGLVAGAAIIMVVLASGASIQVALDSNAFDVLMNWSIFKLQDKGKGLLISALFILMTYLGAFAGTDALIAVVPIGVLFAKKLKLDPIVAMGVTTFATMIGFGTGPTKMFIPQMLMDVPVFSGFGARFISMNFFMVVGLLFLLRYIKKIEKDPTKSTMGNTDWLKNDEEFDASELEKEQLERDTHLTWRHILVLLVFVMQYVIIVYVINVDPSKALAVMTGVNVVGGLLMGLISGMGTDGTAASFGKGLANMAFVGFIIGLAQVVTLVMNQGNITHTIVYVLTKPLMGLNKAISSVGIAGVIAVINPLVPSASGKAAMLIPIIKPVTEALNIHPQIAVQAFQYGDGFTNLISPALGWTIGSAAMAKVPFDKWVKWVFPKVIIFTLLGFVWLYALYTIGWTGL